MTQRKPSPTTGDDYERRLEQTRAEGDQEKQAILGDVLGRVRVVAGKPCRSAQFDQCGQCKLPPPADWCWQSSYACPLGFPPRNVDPQTLLRLINDLQKRVTALETSDDPTN